MATFFSASAADQRDVAGNTMSFHNYSSSNPYSDASAGGLIPLPGTIVSQGSFAGVTNIAPSRLREHSHISHGDGRNEAAFMQTMDGSTNSNEMGLQTQLLMLNEQPNASPVQHQGLSLSLSTQIPVSLYQYRPTSPGASFLSPPANRNMQTNSSIQNSKYLKAARELLDEVVNVREALKRKADKNQSHTSAGTSDCKDADAGSKNEDKPSNPQESAGNSSTELSPSERQDLQNKVTALLAMLDQVDRRYRHYYHQMQIVMSSFDAIAGPGAAKPYTALALQTISRHFRSLRDAISGQIQATRRSLGEQDTSSKGGGISRLRYIDQQMRQQRAMQQFGMMQQHTWRPQRGLPESSVSVLRAWLFEHFLHPYPKDSEKIMLARQTGLSRGQVSNWFINARVRLWKPMIEDMYREEFGAEIDSNSSSENPTKGKDEARSSEDHEELQSPPSDRNGTSQLNPFKSEAVAGIDVPGLSTVGFQNLDSSMDAYTSLNLNHQRPNDGDSSLLQDALGHQNSNARFMAYHMAELGGYDSGGVSLTLGLQHCNGGLPVPAEQQSLLTVRGDDIYSNAGDFDYMNNSEDRQRFSSSSQLLHDFVA